MADEKQKLGPNVTYTNPDGNAKLSSIGGIVVKEGESVNLVEKLGEARANALLPKLAKNRYFKVDGGPDHKQAAESQADTGSPELVSQALQEEARIRREQGDEAADKYIESLDESGRQKEQAEEPAARRGQAKTGEPPPDVKTPEQATLETPPRRRPTSE